MNSRRLMGSLTVILFVIVFFRTVFDAGPLRVKTVLQDFSTLSFDLSGLSDLVEYFVTFDFVPFVGFSLDESASLGRQILQICKEIFVTPLETIFTLITSLFDFIVSLFDNLIALLKVLVKVLGIPDIFPSSPEGGYGGHRGGR